MPPPSHIKDIAPPEHLTSLAANGFASGALRFGTISLITHFLLNRTNPIYRGLTVQFKVYIQISAMLLGGCIFAEKRVTEYNDSVRRRNRALERSRRAWSEEMEIREMTEQKERTRTQEAVAAAAAATASTSATDETTK
ncbi:hypothetical protein HRR83_002279 [Exophiala dermatitidis]|uniref:HIG1 domain-containing protein n=2 Tax=Exophiala dermatitidis TaxID=5970 RepID=H6BY16_EXODN|nr:uncharacterized protein HMPREF1120_04713 [Exophiala dermatitidis NIH/UT8656]KAJ4520297.1 hypothetical protein HRR75_002162 [Exophiala dermatitidis]EHY56638.1 hypothetical protein HMPREF1120_04713 [Exophiala dermatitidis NIH/UT8656]KAJ4524159.1 hypothetical protein HRR74_002356 [Exophiala dermatitidis]KAJ4525569.1 hypothetical protein HRR73_002299 [Exophiala dermatitidis]KAJ4536886.1 hypothetical protein HRR76_004912 [Exophiala dermatitidis]